MSAATAKDSASGHEPRKEQIRHASATDQLLVEGEPFALARLLVKGSFAAASAGVGVWLLRQGDFTGDGSLFLLLAAISFLISLALLCNRCCYIDFSAAVIITVTHFAGIRIGTNTRHLREFERIVVRHLCYSSEEGPCTYSGSVGLKPPRGEVFWVKHFPTSEDELPPCAYEFATMLEERTGIAFVPHGGKQVVKPAILI
jgi:hypothetical protein